MTDPSAADHDPANHDPVDHHPANHDVREQGGQAETAEELYFVYITAGDEAAALSLGRALVAARLAACANVLSPMRSVYWWQGELQEASEAVLVLKTTGAKIGALTRLVRELHAYDCPCVVALPIRGGNPDYLAWLAREAR